jgi:L-iditol 2-dehydrogenase
MVEQAPAKTMWAAVLHGREDLRMEQVARPRPAAGELVLRVGAALTCGTDLKVYRRGYHAMMGKVPFLFGHELAGTVVELGPGVTQFALGDRVVPLNSAPCDACFWCLRGQQNLCEDLLFNNGAYAEYMRIPARIVEKNTLLVPPTVPFEYAALTEPLACVIRGLEESAARPGDTMAVIGAGPIGLMFIHAAQLSGLDVIAVVKREDQVAAALTFGARDVVHIDETPDVVAAVRALTPAARGVDIAIDAVATPATWEQAVAMVRKGGTVNFFGGPPAGTVVALDTNRLHYGDITLKASFHHTPATARTAFALLTGGRFKCREYITGTAALNDVPQVFERMMVRGQGTAAPQNGHGLYLAASAAPLDIKTAVFPTTNGGGQ